MKYAGRAWHTRVENHGGSGRGFAPKPPPPAPLRSCLAAGGLTPTDHNRALASAHISSRYFPLTLPPLPFRSHRTLQVVLSADNIFNRCRSKSRIGHPAESNPLHQLDVIGNYVSDLGAIIKGWRIDQAKRAARAED